MARMVEADEFEASVPVLVQVTGPRTSGTSYSSGSSPSDPTYTQERLVTPPPSVMPAQNIKRPQPSYNDGEQVDWTGPVLFDVGAGDLLVGFKSPIAPRSTQGTGYIMRQIFVNGDVSAQFIWQSPRVPTGGGRLAMVFGKGVGNG